MQKPNYYKEAFNEKLNLFFLFLFAVIALSPLQGLIYLGVILEALYLIIVPNLVKYKKLINARKGYNTSQLESSQNRKDRLKELPQNMRSKCDSLEKKLKEIHKLAKKNPQINTLMADELQRLDYLVETYLSFSVNLNNYKNYLLNNNENLIREEIMNIRNRIRNVFSNLKSKNNLDLIHKRMQKKTLLENNLHILDKRLTKINEMKGMAETLQAQLDVIEDTFYLISDHVVSFHPGEKLDINIDNIVSNIESTEKIIQNTYEEVDKLKKFSQGQSLNRL